jgi:serine protease inhibitor
MSVAVSSGAEEIQPVPYYQLSEDGRAVLFVEPVTQEGGGGQVACVTRSGSLLWTAPVYAPLVAVSEDNRQLVAVWANPSDDVDRPFVSIFSSGKEVKSYSWRIFLDAVREALSRPSALTSPTTGERPSRDDSSKGEASPTPATTQNQPPSAPATEPSVALKVPPTIVDTLTFAGMEPLSQDGQLGLLFQPGVRVTVKWKDGAIANVTQLTDAEMQKAMKTARRVATGYEDSLRWRRWAAVSQHLVASLWPHWEFRETNQCFSPAGIVNVLVTAGLGSSGETKREFAQLLKIDLQREIEQEMFSAFSQAGIEMRTPFRRWCDTQGIELAEKDGKVVISRLKKTLDPPLETLREGDLINQLNGVSGPSLDQVVETFNTSREPIRIVWEHWEESGIKTYVPTEVAPLLNQEATIFCLDVRCRLREEYRRYITNSGLAHVMQGNLQDEKLLSALLPTFKQTDLKITPLTRWIILNSLAIRYPWMEEFSGTLTRPFYVSPDNHIAVDMMSEIVPALVGRLGEFHVTAVELPTRHYGLNLVILLPDPKQRVDECLSGVVSRFSELCSLLDTRLQWKNVKLTLPLFEVAAQCPVAELLKAAGMRRAFELEEADFSKMVEGESIALDVVLQQTQVGVNQRELRASAQTVATGVTLGIKHAEETITVDRPFIFLIRHRYSGIILFCGVVVDPRGSSNPRQ